MQCHFYNMEKKGNMKDLNWEVLAKHVCGENLSHEELVEKERMENSEFFQNEMKQNKNMLQNVDNYFRAKSFNTEAAWKNVKAQTSPAELKVVQRKKVRKEAILKLYKYAAILIIAVLLGSVAYYIGFKNQATNVFNQTISAENQVLNEFVLPDGTKVSLNNNSQLNYPKSFTGEMREVTLVGEGFFDVKPNPEKPFIINAGNAQVKVLGTSFNVSAYPETETVEVVVKSGKVQVSNNLGEAENEISEVFLNPGDKSILFNESNILEKTENLDPNYLAWKTHDLIFNEVPLNEVIQCLEKVYHVEIELAEPELNDLLLEAHFDKKPIDFILNVVRLTFDLNLSEENKQFTLSSRTNEQVKL